MKLVLFLFIFASHHCSFGQTNNSFFDTAINKHYAKITNLKNTSFEKVEWFQPVNKNQLYLVEKCKNLKILDLSNFRTVKNIQLLLDKFGKLNKLEGLILDNISLDTLKLNGYSVLRYLSTDNTRLKYIDISIGNLINLEYFDLNRCQKHFCNPTAVDKLPSSFENLQRLKYFNVNKGNFKSIPNSLLTIKSLIYLNFNNNFISEIQGNISKLTNLEYFSISNNLVQNISPSLTQLKKLKSLELAGNQINNAPKELCNLINLERLNISDNPLVVGENTLDLQCLNSLKYLDLSKLNLEKFPEISNIPKGIQYLRIEKNRITGLPNLGDFLFLKTIWITGNEIENVQSLKERYFKRGITIWN